MLNQASSTPGNDAGRVDGLVRELSAVLDNPGHPAHAFARLKQADRLFGQIDRHMRAGGPVPSGWRVEPPGAVATQVCATACYDGCSEELRTRGGVVAANKALLNAVGHWEALDSAMHSGSPLPEPWGPA